jgi:hypothetical protein
MGIGAIVLALVVGGAVLATRGSGSNVADVTSTQEIAKRAPAAAGNAPAPAHAGQDLTNAGKRVAPTHVGKPAAQKCAKEKQSEAGDDKDTSGDDGPDAGGSSDDCGAAAEDNDRTGADQPGSGEEGGDPTGDDGPGADADSGDNQSD